MKQLVNEDISVFEFASELVKWLLMALWLGFTGLLMYFIKGKISTIESHGNWLKKHDIEIADIKKEQERNSERDNDARNTLENYAQKHDKMFHELIQSQKEQSKQLNEFLVDYKFVLEKLRNKEMNDEK